MKKEYKIFTMALLIIVQMMVFIVQIEFSKKLDSSILTIPQLMILLISLFIKNIKE